MLLMTNQLLITASQDKSLKIWYCKDLKNIKCLKTLDAHEDWVTCLLELPNNILVSGCNGYRGGYIKLWDFNNDEKNITKINL